MTTPPSSRARPNDTCDAVRSYAHGVDTIAVPSTIASRHPPPHIIIIIIIVQWTREGTGRIFSKFFFFYINAKRNFIGFQEVNFGLVRPGQIQYKSACNAARFVPVIRNYERSFGCLIISRPKYVFVSKIRPLTRVFFCVVSENL